MTLGKSVRLATLGAVAAILLCATAALIVQNYVMRDMGVESLKEQMQSALSQAENVRASVSQLNQEEAFDTARLKLQLGQGVDYRSTTLYRTVPVVASWNAVKEAATRNGFKFRVVRENPRNQANRPSAKESEILRSLAAGQDTFFEVDETNDVVTYARPVHLTADCLKCHGDSSLSPSGDGKDILGFQMEGWQAGQVRGAFVLTSGTEKSPPPR